MIKMTRLRKATKDDCMLMFRWANDREVRKNSFSLEKISLENHIKWYESKIENNKTYIFIAVKDNVEVGQIRVDIDDGVGIISYSVDSNYRGQGIGTEILNLIKSEFNNLQLIGFVKKDNIASIKAFEKNGYKKIKNDDFLEFIYKLD